MRYFYRALGPLDAPAEIMDSLFEAIRQYKERMVSTDIRVMHGRAAFDPGAGRRIRLYHVDCDEFYGYFRNLGARFGRPDCDLFPPRRLPGMARPCVPCTDG